MGYIESLIQKIGTGQYKDGSSVDAGVLYHKSPFKGMEDVKTHRGDTSADENALILNRLVKQRVKGSRILDVGCANMWHSFSLATLGAHVKSWEADSNVIKLNKALLSEHGKFDGSIFLYDKYFDEVDAKTYQTMNIHFDYTLMMNVHMWIHKQIGKDRCLDMMQTIADICPKLFFQTCGTHNEGMYCIPEFKNDDDILGYLRYVGYSTVEKLSKGEDSKTKSGRTLFYCER